MKNDIIEFGLTELGKRYFKERMNFLLQYNELSLNNNKLNIRNDFRKANWEEIRRSLGKDECAVLMYDYDFFSINLSSGVVILPDAATPQDLNFQMGNSSPIEFINLLEKVYPNCKNYYICPLGKWENIDVAYDNPRVHLKHSLMDLTRHPKSLHYDGGIISIFADINYSDNKDDDDVPPLHDGKRIISKTKELFGSKIYSLSGNNVKRINFMNIIDDISIFHVSTHGMARPIDISPKDSMELYNSFVGNTSMLGYGLALSNYNENHSRYFISAKDVKDQVKLTGNQLVYLDACETGQSRTNYFGPNGLAKSFYFAGARNVIAYITKINEKVATDFAINLYEEIKRDPTQSYHDIFYKVKSSIIQKYKGSQFLNIDSYGRPNLGILLWE